MIALDCNWNVISFSPCGDWDAVFYDSQASQTEDKFLKERIVGFAVASDKDGINHIKPVIRDFYEELCFAESVRNFIGLLHKDVAGIPEDMRDVARLVIQQRRQK